MTRELPGQVIATDLDADVREVRLVDVSDLFDEDGALIYADPNNARMHSDAELARLTNSIQEHGLLESIAVNRLTGQIVGGHGRAEAALRASRGKMLLLVTEKDFLGQRAANISLNVADYGHNDDAMLAEQLADLAASLDPANGDILEQLETLTSVPPWQLDTLVGDLDFNGPRSPAPPFRGDEDDAPPLPDEPKASYGDLYVLGRHRLLCGDATNSTDMRRLLGGETVEMLFTDPPYGVGYEGGQFHSNDPGIQRKRKPIAGDTDDSLYLRFLPVMASHLDGPAYMWAALSRAGLTVFQALAESGYEIHAEIIWHKTNAKYAAIGASYKQRHESMLFFKPKGSTLRWCGPGNECTLWEIDRDATNTYHPTQKPVALAARAIANHTARNICDPFAGSGSTLIAAEEAERPCFAMEIDPAYCDVVVGRWEAFTGETATLIEHLAVES